MYTFGMPVFTFVHDENCPFKTTRCWWFFKKSFKRQQFVFYPILGLVFNGLKLHFILFVIQLFAQINIFNSFSLITLLQFLTICFFLVDNSLGIIPNQGSKLQFLVDLSCFCVLTFVLFFSTMNDCLFQFFIIELETKKQMIFLFHVKVWPYV